MKIMTPKTVEYANPIYPTPKVVTKIKEPIFEEYPEANNINTAHYTNLPPGVYTFKVVSSNYDGLWGEIPAMLQFEILKPWYSTNLAFILYFLILVLMGYS